MYLKHEAAQLKKEFWSVFGQYMSPVPSVNGEKINWINYKTGEKNIYFRMHADNKKATISIELTHKDKELQALYFEQFQELKSLLHNTLKEQWQWLPHTYDEHEKIISVIYTSIANVNILNKADWKHIISFFKPRIIALDEFWTFTKYVFEAIR